MATELERTIDARGDGPPSSGGVVDLIRKMTPEMQRALPRHLDGDRMARLALTELRRTPQLQRASAESLLGALMWAAQLGLEPGPLGHVYLVPRTIQGRVEVVFVIGYRGLVELAYRSGQVADIHARVVWRGEPFRYSAGDEERVEHEPRLDTDPTPEDFVAAYAIAHLRGGGILREVIGPRHLARARRASAIQSTKGPWSTDFEAMARKTAVRRLAALLPQSAELALALNADEAIAPRIAEGRITPIEDASPAAELEPPPLDEPEPREAEPVDAGPRHPPILTPAQERRIGTLMRELGVPRGARRHRASEIVGRSIDTVRDLTRDEAENVIEALERMPVPAGPPPAEAPDDTEPDDTEPARELDDTRQHREAVEAADDTAPEHEPEHDDTPAPEQEADT